MLTLRLLLMVLSIICLMDGYAEVSSSTTGIRNGEENLVLQEYKEVQNLDRKKKKPKKQKKNKKPKGKKSKKTNQPKPVTPTPPMTTSTLQTTTSTMTTTARTISTATTTITARTTSTVTTTPATTATPTLTSTTTTSTDTTTGTSSSSTSSPSTIDATTADSGGDCKATNGKDCVFPFKDDNKEYNECKDHKGTYYWCATKVYESGKYMHWSYCPKDGSCPLSERTPGCKATNNKPCIFPFKDGNKEYNECADFKGSYFWCATGINSAGKYTSWEKCPKDGSCPLLGQSLPPEVTTTATSTTVYTTGSTESNQMEEKVLDTLEDLILGETRDDSLHMAHMLNEKLETIIKDLEGGQTKSGQNSSEDIPSASVKLNVNIKLGEKVRDGTEFGEGLMFMLSTVDSMKSVSRVSDDCCSDCKSKHSDTVLAEYWKTLDACYCYKKKTNPDGTEMVPKTWASSEFTTKACEPSGCGYNSDVDPDRLLAEQNSAYLLSMMSNTKYTDVFEVLNWNQGFANPTINHKLFEDLENKKAISSGYFMMFLAPASVSCDKSVFEETEKKLHPIQMNQFSNLKAVKEDLNILVNSMEGKVPQWLKIVYQDMSPHVCITLQSTYYFVAINRVQTFKNIFNFALESQRYPDKFYPFKDCSTKTLTMTAMKNVAEVNDGGIMFERSEIDLYEWEALLPVVLKRISVKNPTKVIVFIETETETADENDFIGYNGPVVFNKGQNIAVILFHVNRDEEVEINESFYLTLKASENTNGGSNVKVILKESLSTEIQTRNEDLPKSLTRLMTGAIMIVGAQMRGADGIDSNPLEILKNLYFVNNNINHGEYEGLKIEKFDEGTNEHDVVVFKNQATLMNEFDNINNFGQTILAGRVTTLFYWQQQNWPKVVTKKKVLYLPWMEGAIAIRKLDSGYEYAFTAQLSGCGVRIFTIKGSKSYDGIYMSHDNAIGLPIGCPGDGDLALRLKNADIIQDPIVGNQITFSATLHPTSIPLPIAQTTPVAGPTLYASHFLGPSTFSNPDFYIGRSTVIAIQKPRWFFSSPEWCLVFQRNIEVYDTRHLDPLVLFDIFGNNDNHVVLDPSDPNNHEEFANSEPTLVMRPKQANPLASDYEFEYEMKCDNSKIGTFHKVAHADIQNKYWKMKAKYVESNGDVRIMITHNSFYPSGPDLKTLLNFVISTPYP